MSEKTMSRRVNEFAERIVLRRQYVTLDAAAIASVAGLVQKADLSANPAHELTSRIVFRELAAGAVNYCYWYGWHDTRPGDAGSGRMYQLLDKAIGDCPLEREAERKAVLERFSELMRLAGFPLSGRRTGHLRELAGCGRFMRRVAGRRMTADQCVAELVRLFPGYAEDVFLKRAFLFVIMLFRETSCFADSIAEVPIPADYQVPKMLRWHNCLRYTPELSDKIRDGVTIQPGSGEECAIRAAAIVACNRIADLAGVKPCDVDTYLWCGRKSCDQPFHLTLTTDY